MFNGRKLKKSKTDAKLCGVCGGIAEFLGIYEAQENTGIRRGDISACCRGTQKTAGGFQWSYK